MVRQSPRRAGAGPQRTIITANGSDFNLAVTCKQVYRLNPSGAPGLRETRPSRTIRQSLLAGGSEMSAVGDICMEPTKPVRSGTTMERWLRAALLAVVINGFAAAFLWDGYFGYARENVESLVKSLGLSVEPLPAFNPNLTAELARESLDRQATLPAIGEPALTVGEDAYFFGPAGYIKAHRERGKSASLEWVDGPAHSATDLMYQRWIGYALGVLGLVALGHLGRVATTRAVLSDQGLAIRGKRLITIEAMHGIRDKRTTGGTLEIEYRDGEAARSVELDSYVYRDRDAIVEAICEAKGFDNPLQPVEATDRT